VIDWIKGIWSAITGGFSTVFAWLVEGWRVLRILMIKFNLWFIAAVTGLMIVLKSTYDFLVTIFDRIIMMLQANDITHLQGGVEGDAGGGILQVVAFFNTFMPIDELFAWANFMLAWWMMCHFMAMFLKVAKLIRG